MLASTSKLLSQIDLDLVNQQIRMINLHEWEYDQIADMLIRAADKWLECDLHNWDYAIVETKEVEEGFSFIFDLVLAKGTRAIAKDWKTGKIDRFNYDVETKWTDQSSIYLTQARNWLSREHKLELESLEYRCVGEDKLKSIMVYPNEIHPDDSTEQKLSTQNMYWALVDSPVWPRNRPSACRSYGYSCPWISDCNKMTMRRYAPSWAEMKAVAPRSKSAFKDFLSCPERYRREKVLKDEAPGGVSNSAQIGVAYHLGAASIWSQCFERKV